MESQMLKIKMPPEIVSKFKELIEEEDNDDAVIRIREAKVGGGCKSRICLKVSIDEREDPDEEQEVVVEGIPIVVNNDVIDGYGEEYEMYVDDHNMPAVRSASQKENQAACSKSACEKSESWQIGE